MKKILEWRMQVESINNDEIDKVVIMKTKHENVKDNVWATVIMNCDDPKLLKMLQSSNITVSMSVETASGPRQKKLSEYM